MSELTSAPDATPVQAPPGSSDRPRRSLRQQPWVPVAVQVVGVLVLCALAGLGAGWLWQHLWHAPSGVVADHTWYVDSESGLRADFAGTGIYVLVALGTGLVVGAVVAVVFDRSELVTLAAVTLGSVLAAWVMWKVGVHASAVDPHEAAKTAADGTKLPGNLHVSGSGRLSLHWHEIRVPAAYVAFPVGALSSLAVVFMGLTKRGHGRV